MPYFEEMNKKNRNVQKKMRNINSDNNFLHFVEMSTQLNEMCKTNLIIRKRFLLNVQKQVRHMQQNLDMFYKILQGIL